MTLFVRAVPSKPIIYPFTLEMLASAVLAESGGRTVITSKDPSLYLGPPYFLLPVASTHRPVVDARTERLAEGAPALVGDQWTQQWTVTPATDEEIELWDISNPPQAEWLAFAAALNQNAYTLSLAAMAQRVPAVLLLLSNLSVGMGQAAKGDSSTFQEAWKGGIIAGVISAEMIAVVTELAEQFNLPLSFRQGLSPPTQP